MRRKDNSRKGSTLLECAFAMGLVGIFFSAIYAMNSQCLYMLNSGRGAAFASQSLQDRVEQLRDCTWSELTDASYIQNSVLNSSTNGMRNLGNATETVSINLYPAPLSPGIIVVRSGGSVTTASSNASIANGDMVRVDIAVSWKAGLGGRSREQATTTVIAKNGS